MGRKISNGFLKKLNDGEYNVFLKIIEKKNKEAQTDDEKLTLFLRGDYVSIYFKTLQLLKIRPKSKPLVNYNYFKNTKLEDRFKQKNNECEVEVAEFGGCWENYFNEAMPLIKKYNELNDNKEHTQTKSEKRYQQILTMQNQFPESAYQIIDVEYAHNSIIPSKRIDNKNKRFDALAIYKADEKTKKLGLAFIELKVGDGVVSGNSGIYKHLYNAGEFSLDLDKYPEDICSPKRKYKDVFYDDLNAVIRQLNQLKLLKLDKEWQLDVNIKPQMLFALADLPNKENNTAFLNELTAFHNKLVDYSSSQKDKFCRAAKENYEVLFDFDLTETDMKLRYNKMKNLRDLGC